MPILCVSLNMAVDNTLTVNGFSINPIHRPQDASCSN